MGWTVEFLTFTSIVFLYACAAGLLRSFTTRKRSGMPDNRTREWRLSLLLALLSTGLFFLFGWLFSSNSPDDSYAVIVLCGLFCTWYVVFVYCKCWEQKVEKEHIREEVREDDVSIVSICAAMLYFVA